MNNFHSHWLIKHLETSSKSPTERLINLFDMMEKLPGSALPAEGHEELLRYLTAIARSSNIHHPEFFAQQILFMAAEAREKQLSQPESLALKHAQIAAKALISAQTKNRFRRNSHLYAMAASFFLIFGVSSMMLNNKLLAPSKELQLGSIADADNHQAFEAGSNPKRLSEMLSSREKMRNGTCRFPEALMLAEADRGIYLKTVVYGEISHDEGTARLMQTVSCDYTPMLMKNSIS
jgi:hypothetical protein